MPTLCWRWSPLHVNFDISFCFSSTTPKAASASIQAANSLQAAAFVNEEHKRGVWGSQDLCPHCETFKGFRWVLGCAREREREREQHYTKGNSTYWNLHKIEKDGLCAEKLLLWFRIRTEWKDHKVRLIRALLRQAVDAKLFHKEQLLHTTRICNADHAAYIQTAAETASAWKPNAQIIDYFQISILNQFRRQRA